MHFIENFLLRLDCWLILWFSLLWFYDMPTSLDAFPLNICCRFPDALICLSCPYYFMPSLRRSLHLFMLLLNERFTSLFLILLLFVFGLGYSILFFCFFSFITNVPLLWLLYFYVSFIYFSFVLLLTITPVLVMGAVNEISIFYKVFVFN